MLIPIAATIGTGRMLKKTSDMNTICAKGNGKCTVLIFCASTKCTIPMENSWNTRERIGGAMSMTPVRAFSTTNLWIHCNATYCFADVAWMYLMLAGSMPSKAKCGKRSRSRPEMSDMEKQSAMLNSRVKTYWNSSTLSCNSGCVLQKAIRLLHPFSHTPHARSTSVMPSQYRAYDNWARKTMRKPKMDVNMVHAVVSAESGWSKYSEAEVQVWMTL
mmetsp:Transcript_77813/g.225823  ORF Transcript_77813/g.225823 Transcript_77813/m.225823 type:complete len:217 (-) Transcript_77813:257-907(-)